MISAQHRLRSSKAFVSALRAGKRGRSRTVVVHVQNRADEPTTQVGFAVSKAVGNAVVRHRVTRRLRSVARDLLDSVPSGSAIVVRALPAAASATVPQLHDDCAVALAEATR